MTITPLLPTVRFGGLLLKAVIGRQDRPQFNAYFGDYHRVSEQFGDGVVLMQPLDRHKKPVVLEEDNEIVRFTTESLRDNHHLEKRTPWPWPDDLRPLFNEAWSRLTHDANGWLSRLGRSVRDADELYEDIFDGHRPDNVNITFLELAGEPFGFRHGRHSGAVEPNGRRPLLDYDFVGLLDDQAAQLRLNVPLPKPASQPDGKTPDVDYVPQGPIPRAVKNVRVTIPGDVAAWLKAGEGNVDLVRLLMDPQYARILKWLQRHSNAELAQRIVNLNSEATTE